MKFGKKSENIKWGPFEDREIVISNNVIEFGFDRLYFFSTRYKTKKRASIVGCDYSLTLQILK